jgi:Flp pilus assembly pilin Flp
MWEFPHILFTRLLANLLDEKGQDLVEYTLTFTMIALGSVAGMSAVAQGVNQTFLALGNVLTTAVA